MFPEAILAHYRAPRHRGALDGASGEHTALNPLCGDRLTAFVDVEDGRIRSCTWDGQGCAVCQAAASLMCDAVTGLATGEVPALEARLARVIAGETPPAEADLPGDLAALACLSEIPARQGCARFPWRALRGALEASDRSGRDGAPRP